VVICLKCGADDLHMVQLTPLPPRHLLLHKNPEWFNVSGAALPRMSWKTGHQMGVLYCHMLLLTATSAFGLGTRE